MRGLLASTAGGLGLIPGQGTKSPHAVWRVLHPGRRASGPGDGPCSQSPPWVGTCWSALCLLWPGSERSVRAPGCNAAASQSSPGTTEPTAAGSSRLLSLGVCFEKEILYLNKKTLLRKRKVWEQIFTKCTFNKELVSRLYKERLQLNNKTNNPIKNGEKMWTDILPKKIY